MRESMYLETERLILREFTMDDLDAFASLMADPEVMRFSLSGPMKDIKQAKEYLQKRILDHYAKFGYGLYAVIHKIDNCLIGSVGLIMQNIDGENKTELGYRLHPNYWGKGLATEAALAICQDAFERLGIDELISIIDPQNIRSLEVAKRIGMHYQKDAIFHRVPVNIYAIKKQFMSNGQAI
jgi:[ribosomal protein S5]-alanine N-acetyltransferase